MNVGGASPAGPPPRRSNLAKLYGAEVVSGAGDGIMWVALVAALAEQPRDGLWIGLGVLARLGPRAVLSLPIGPVLDRSSLRPVLVGADLTRAVLIGVATVLVANEADIGPVLLAVAVSYVAATPTRPALAAVLPRVSGETHLAGANAVLSAIRQVMTFIGPLIGVGVVAWSSTAAFAINSASFVVAAALVAALRSVPWPTRRSSRRSVRRARRRSPLASWRSSVGAIRTAAGLPALVVLIGAMYFVRGAEMVLYVIVVRDVLGEDPARFGYLAGAVGLGAVLATPLARRGGDAAHPIRAIVASVALTAVPTTALAFSDRLGTAVVLLVFVGAGMVVFEVVSVVTVQRAVPDALGRAFGVVNSASNSGKLLGAVGAPPLVLVFGADGALIAVAAVVSVLTVAVAPSLRRLGAVADDERHRLEPIVEVLAGLGLFEGAGRASLERVAAVATTEHAAPGDVLIREGDTADDLFVGVDGELTVRVGGERIGGLGPGDWFGEIGLVEHLPRTATVVAATPAIVWRIPGEIFLGVLEESGSPPTALVEGIADRLGRGRPI